LQADGKSRAFALFAVDRQAALMAVGDVLDQRKAQSGSALRAALADIDAVKALGQPRDGFAGNPFALVLDRDEDAPRL